MKCHICNNTLTPEEISWNKLHGDWNPCRVCQEIIDSVFDDPLTEEEIDHTFSEENDLYDTP